jgi:DNA polymerase III delta prime subunit
MKSADKPVRSGKIKPIAVNFNGGKLTSDTGVVLLQQVDLKIRLTERINELIHDFRNPLYTTHPQHDLIAQRIYAIALAYEDVNDHNQLRHDPALLAAIKNTTDEEQPLGSAPTLSRFENRITKEELAGLSKLFVELFLESHDVPPKQIIIDVDATDDTIHGNQEGKHFNGFYDDYCFLPLYFFCGDQLLWSQLRSSKSGGAHGTLAIFDYLATRIKESWPDVEIILRADAGFYSPKLLRYCDRHGYKFIIGYSSNAVLKKLSEKIVFASEMFFVDAGSSEALRLFWEYEYKAKKWDHARKVIVKAERLPDGDNLLGKENTRYIVTNLEGNAQELYENVYCARGDMENRIKEQQQMMFADRTSCHSFEANRFRLFLSSAAYVLVETLRRTALVGTSMAKAQCSTIRVKLFKVAAVVTESVRRIVFSLSGACPTRELWLRIFRRFEPGRAFESGRPVPAD